MRKAGGLQGLLKAKPVSKKPDACIPFPQAVRPDVKDWKIEEGQREPGGYCRTFVGSGVMQIPLDDSKASAYLRRHEMIHARISPKTPPKGPCRQFSYLAAEDMRVSVYSRSLGFPDFCVYSKKEVSAILSRIKDSPPMLAATIAAVFKEELLQRKIRKVIEAEHPDLLRFYRGVVSDLRDLTGSAFYPGFDLSKRVAEYLDSFYDVKPEEKKSPEGPGPVEKSGGECPRQRGPHGNFGPVLWEFPPLSRSVSSVYRIFRRAVAKDVGTVPARLHRFCVDGKIFRRKILEHGGTILLDGSGSMHHSPERIGRLLEHAPAAEIVLYFGHRQIGFMRTLVKGGKMVAEENMMPHCGNNLIDGPALEYLATRPEPRIWISDGQVTGPEGFSQTIGKARCAAICKRGRITRVHSIADLLAGSRR